MFINIKKLTDKKGQILVEMLIGFPFIIVFVFLFLSLSYFVFLKIQLHFFLHEIILCKESSTSTFICQARLNERLKQILPFGKIESLQFKRKPNFSSVKIKIKIFSHLRNSFFAKSFGISSLYLNESKKIQLPLKRSLSQ